MRATRIGLTVGDPAGIGPEVVLKALALPLDDRARAVVYAPIGCLLREDERLCELVEGWEPLSSRLVVVESPDDPVEPGHVAVRDVRVEGESEIEPGAPHPWAARVQGAALRMAIADAKVGVVDGICTAPWTKSIFGLIGEPQTGHTEVLAAEFDAPHHVMMLAGERLRVSLVTTHLPLAKVSGALSVDRIVDTIATTAEDLRVLWGVERPRVAVCGLNPHAGEGGVMGDDELRVIGPAIARARAMLDWVDITDPMPSDTLFAPYGRGEAPHDAVVCMYHDQGLIPLKLLHFGRSANITLGLPVVRTSVDHGTAWDIAGRGIADGGSMRYALELAVELARNKAR